MRLQLVLAGLARQDHHEGQAEVMDDGLFDGARDLDLVGPQVDVAGVRPGDRAAADGGAHYGGEAGFRGHFSPRWRQDFQITNNERLKESRQGLDLAVSEHNIRTYFLICQGFQTCEFFKKLTRFKSFVVTASAVGF